MIADKNDFFRQVTLALCSSLDINTALHRCMLYLRSLFPVDTLMFGISDPEACTISHVAAANAAGPLPEVCRTITLPPEVARLLASSIYDSDRLVPDTQLDPLTRAVAPYVKNRGCSEIILPLRIRDDRIGYMVMQAKGLDLYGAGQMELMASVREPLTIAMVNALRHQEVVALKDRLEEDNRYLQKELAHHSHSTIIGAESGLRNTMEIVHQVAPLNSTVLLLGETGVGKEVVANAIHRLSPRREGPFIKVNCGAIPETLIDSELFGHEKGAFSGAVFQKRGRFERAHGGTIFLDEVGELPPAAQIRLLRVLQNKEIERVGGTRSIHVDIRVIAATHRNLEKMISEREFREDLWFRINTFPIIIPPLRHRKEDIPLLLQHFVARKAEELGFRSPPTIAQGALETLTTYPWPGNVRELENVVERALIQNKGRALTLDAFTLSQHPNGPLRALDDACGCVFPCLAWRAEKPSPLRLGPTSLRLDDVLYKHIKEVLELTGGKVHGSDGAAEQLGINPSTLRHKMNKLGIAYGRQVR